jgi:putative sigma-54 modulation protein
MNLNISGHHLEVTPALRDYVAAKFERIMRHFDHVIDCDVLLALDNRKEKAECQRAEATLHIKGKELFAESADSDLYAAIDLLMDKLDRQVIRYKERQLDRLHDRQHNAIKRHELQLDSMRTWADENTLH